MKFSVIGLANKAAAKERGTNMKRVHFIGHGYESIRFILVEEELTSAEAFAKAEEWYKKTGQTFDYVELEISL